MMWNGLHNPALTLQQADVAVLGLPFDGAAARKWGSGLGVINLDAHLDLCFELEGNRLSHGCTRRSIMPTLPPLLPSGRSPKPGAILLERERDKSFLTYKYLKGESR